MRATADAEKVTAEEEVAQAACEAMHARSASPVAQAESVAQAGEAAQAKLAARHVISQPR